MNTMDRFLRKMASLVGSFCCILCGEVGGKLGLPSCFFQEFDFAYLSKGCLVDDRGQNS